jgi:hypothetical protein
VCCSVVALFKWSSQNMTVDGINQKTVSLLEVSNVTWNMKGDLTVTYVQQIGDSAIKAVDSIHL